MVCLVLRRNETLGCTVIDDVDEFSLGEATGTGRVDQPCVMAAPDDFEIARVVLHANGDVVTRLESSGAQHVGQPHSALMEILVGGDFASLSLNDCGTVGILICVDAWVHGYQTSE